jgi:hypothetical protein
MAGSLEGAIIGCSEIHHRARFFFAAVLSEVRGCDHPGVAAIFQTKLAFHFENIRPRNARYVGLPFAD